MEKYSYCKELREQYKIDDLDSKTLKYRIDGFIEACDMNLEGSIPEKKISSTFAQYIAKESDEEGLQYNVRLSFRCDYERGESIVVIGDYNDISFILVNFYDKDKKNRIVELPFSLAVEKTVGDIKYRISLESTVDRQVEFSISKDDKQVHFFANILDFSKVLNLVSTFINDPENLFKTYDEIMNKKKVFFTNGDLNKGFEKSDRFEKPVSSFVKKIKMLTTNEGMHKRK